MRSLSIEQRENIDGYIFILPALAYFALFVVYPFFFSFYLSLHQKTGSKLTDISFAAFFQYKKALSDPEFWTSLSHTIIYTFSVVFFQLVLGLIMAVLLNRYILGKDFIRALFFTPVVLSTIVCGTVWVWMYSPEEGGLINRALGILFRIKPIPWLREPQWALFAVIIMSIWKWIGYHMVVYLAALQGISNDYYEAASIEGASGLQKFWRITFPLLSNTSWLLIITSIINSFQVFDQIFVMTKGGPVGATNVVVYMIYKSSFISFDLPYGSAIAWLLFGVIFILTLAQMQIQKKSVV
ncbi:MAG: sugar ABC transporter permease [Treponema sp.]|jgi:multiple sugar transport system permease protein|nr:sugar ABC transporter permease [Treponema sp.]